MSTQPPAPSIRPAERNNYVICQECSKAAGEEVFFHRSLITRREVLFEGTKHVCPRGHPVELPAPAAAS